MCSARRVQNIDYDFRDQGALNDAELGAATLKNALRDPSLFKQVAEDLRDVETLAEVVKMMADPSFQEQANEAAKQLEASGFPVDIFKLENYVDEGELETAQSKSLSTLLLATNPAGMRTSAHPARHAASTMIFSKRAAAKKLAPKKSAPKKVAPKKVAPKKAAYTSVLRPSVVSTWRHMRVIPWQFILCVGISFTPKSSYQPQQIGPSKCGITRIEHR